MNWMHEFRYELNKKTLQVEFYWLGEVVATLALEAADDEAIFEVQKVLNKRLLGQ